MKKEQIAALTLSAALAFGISASTLAADSGPVNVVPTLISQQETAPLPDSVLYYGAISGISRNEKGNITRVQMTSESKGEVVLYVSEDTLYVDAGERSAADVSMLKEGAGLYVFHSPLMATSLPPQTSALVFVGNMPMDMGCPMYHEIEKVEKRNGETVVTTDNGGLELYLTDETEMSAYAKDGSTELKAGGHVMAWYGAVTDSLPGQTRPSHVMVLPETEAQAPETILINGEKQAYTNRLEDGVYMVPVRAVAEALGLEVGYEKADGVRTITITGKDSSAVVTAHSAEAKSGDQIKVLDAEVYVEEPGTTWAPADVFSLLGVSVAETADGLSFTK